MSDLDPLVPTHVPGDGVVHTLVGQDPPLALADVVNLHHLDDA